MTGGVAVGGLGAKLELIDVGVCLEREEQADDVGDGEQGGAGVLERAHVVEIDRVVVEVHFDVGAVPALCGVVRRHVAGAAVELVRAVDGVEDGWAEGAHNRNDKEHVGHPSRPRVVSLRATGQGKRIKGNRW